MTATVPARNRRLRLTPSLRNLFRESRLHPQDLVAPLFVTDDHSLCGPVPNGPGLDRHHVDDLADVVGELAATGVGGVLLFGIPGRKDSLGTSAWETDGVVAQAIRGIRKTAHDLVIIADVCLCQYTTHGHCGVLTGGRIDNDATLELLARASATYGRAGAHLVAPSGMMDGAVGAIRQTLDADDLSDVGILAYSIKHASALYGPFRDVARSTPASGDRRSHQLDPANAREALREATADRREGADVLMVKPALTNLDTLVRLRLAHPDVPLAAYEVSGEYAMLRAAAERGWLDERATSLELLAAIKRAGADIIVTYRAAQAATWIREGAWT